MSDYKILIDGRLVAGDDSIDVINPATEEVLAACPRASVNQLNEAVAAAKAAFPAWSARPIEERRQMIGKMADAMEGAKVELARLLTQEQGKPLAEAMGEGADIRIFAKPTSRPYRRMGVALATAGDTDEARRLARDAAHKVRITYGD